jgi:hypothetical protein
LTDGTDNRTLIETDQSERIEKTRLLQEVATLPGSKVLNQILSMDNPGRFVRSMPSEDFFWLIKKIGEEDCLPLLELASIDQWQYLLDLEVWQRDRLDLTQTSLWLERLEEADCSRLVRWLYREGQSLAFFYFFKNLEVVVIHPEGEPIDIPPGFQTLDGIYYFRIPNPEYRESLEHILRTMSNEDLERYQALLLNLAGVIPAESEESMYRMRNIRLAEHGFLPFEEAAAIYAHLDPKALKSQNANALKDLRVDDEIRALVPAIPFHSIDRGTLFLDTITGVHDLLLLDRLRLELAGLCNQIMAADGLTNREFEDLLESCRKATGYLSLAIERLCGEDISGAEQLVKNNPLNALFRVGFGLALKVKWEAERWLKGSWFLSSQLDTGFWGDYHGGILIGLLRKRPMFYQGLKGEREYRDFVRLAEIGECLKALRQIMVLDSLVEQIVSRLDLKTEDIKAHDLTIHSFILHLWVRHHLNLPPGFEEISLSQARSLFKQLRSGRQSPPFHMTEYGEVFKQKMLGYAGPAEREALLILQETLSEFWEDFEEEYRMIQLQDLDGRYSRFIKIKPY